MLTQPATSVKVPTFALEPQTQILGFRPEAREVVQALAGFSVLRQSASRKAPSRKQGAQKTVRQQSTGTKQRGFLKDARGLVLSNRARFNSSHLPPLSKDMDCVPQRLHRMTESPQLSAGTFPQGIAGNSHEHLHERRSKPADSSSNR